MLEAVPCLLTSCFICAKGSNDQPRHTSKAKLVRARAEPRWGGQVGGGRGPRGADRESPGAVDGRDVLPPGQGPGLKRAPHPRASACMCASRLSSNQQCTRPRLYLRAYLNTDSCKPALPCPPHHLRDPLVSMIAAKCCGDRPTLARTGTGLLACARAFWPPAICTLHPRQPGQHFARGFSILCVQHEATEKRRGSMLQEG